MLKIRKDAVWKPKNDVSLWILPVSITPSLETCAVTACFRSGNDVCCFEGPGISNKEGSEFLHNAYPTYAMVPDG